MLFYFLRDPDFPHSFLYSLFFTSLSTISVLPSHICFDIWPHYVANWGSCSCHAVRWWGTVTIYMEVMSDCLQNILSFCTEWFTMCAMSHNQCGFESQKAHIQILGLFCLNSVSDQAMSGTSKSGLDVDIMCKGFNQWSDTDSLQQTLCKKPKSKGQIKKLTGYTGGKGRRARHRGTQQSGKQQRETKDTGVAWS